nr:uncharacterized protein CI109_005309 [Kwoniella shandongensis]KAA5526353.1 hypothetical protein CI109_005309 [Kwoniella shandongensis]
MAKYRSIRCRLSAHIGIPCVDPTAVSTDPPPVPSATPTSGADLRLTEIVEERAGTAPDGQVLPEWMTYVPYVTTVDGRPITTGSVANLPLTYYGEPIPLRDGWTYGGLTSPTSTPTSRATEGFSNTAQNHDSVFSTSSASSRSPSASSGRSTPQQINPSGTVSRSSSVESSAPLSSANSPVSTHTSRSTTLSREPSTSSPLSPLNTPQTPSSSPLPTSNGDSNSHNVLSPLLGVLIPLAVIMLIILILLSLYRRNRPNRSTSFLKWLTSPSHWSPVPTTEPTTRRAPGARPLPHSPDPRSPNEKSALLPGFVAQHHRNSSSLSVARQDEIEVDNELHVLAKQNQSLLQRLNLGLGWFSTSSNASRNSSRDTSRKASGNTLEKGQGGGRRIFSGAAAALGYANTGSKETTPSTARGGGYEQVLDDDQLFFKPPPLTQSSRGTAISLQTDTTSSSGSKAQAGPGSSTTARNRGTPQTSFSVGVPETPGTEAGTTLIGEADVGEFGTRRSRFTDDGERMHFPVPPGLGLYGDGTFGHHRNGNRISVNSDDTEFHSAQSHSIDDIPSSPSGTPIYRTSSEYRHVSVSAFGSHPSTPTRPDPSSTDHTTSSLSKYSQPSYDPSSGPFFTPILSPSPAQARNDDTIRPIGNLFGVGLTRPHSVATEAGSRDSGEVRRSWAGQPMIDENSLRQGHRGVIGEFGESLRPPYVAPTLVSASRQSLFHTSEIGSIHHDTLSSASHSHSGSSSGHSHAQHDRAVRGKRSQQQLIRASRLGSIGTEDVIPPLPDSRGQH